jgi:hypothetical protein
MKSQNTPKGWFHPSGSFVQLDWSKNFESNKHLPYLATLHHEQIHYLQHTGTSFGQFLADVEDIWSNAIISSVLYALKNSKKRTWSIEEWVKKEENLTVRNVLNQSIDLFKTSKRMIEIINIGGSNSTLHEFTMLYRKILEDQINSQNGIWYVNPELMPRNYNNELPSEGYCNCSSVMECAAAFSQLEFIGKVDLESGKDLPDYILSALVDEKGQESTASRVESCLYSDYSEPYRLISGYLPADPIEAQKLLFIIIDLALMPPIGRFNRLAAVPPTFADILPNIRLFQAAGSVSRLGLKAKDVFEDYSEIVDAICVDQQWPQPEWIAIKTPRLSIGHENLPYAKAILDLQLYASKYRIKKPGAFALLRAPLMDDMRIPIIYYSDGVRTGVSKDIQCSLMARYFKIKCAESWILGKKPPFPPISGFSETFDGVFNEIFGIKIKDGKLT